ncbi:MAG: selenocysteine-specific translation elongation factor SelB [Frankiales bacterium]|nr:selenocysteine-specific translation elongation factor SelB [Frankiales bacterium]
MVDPRRQLPRTDDVLDDPRSGSAEGALDVIEQRLRDDPFDAPLRSEVEELGLSPTQLTTAQTAGRLHLVGEFVLLPDAVDVAVARLASCPQPFTVVEGRQAMGASRPVAVALLDHLDQLGLTRPLVGGVRMLTAPE